jgi:hypothetical protein
MSSRTLIRSLVVGTAAVVVLIGAYAGVSHARLDTASAAPPAHAGPNQRIVGRIPPNWHSGSGTIITGTAANKAKAVAVAKYPGGVVNRVLKLDDGSYAVHMIKISWPHHVFVSKTFKVTGAIG